MRPSPPVENLIGGWIGVSGAAYVGRREWVGVRAPDGVDNSPIRRTHPRRRRDDSNDVQAAAARSLCARPLVVAAAAREMERESGSGVQERRAWRRTGWGRFFGTTGPGGSGSCSAPLGSGAAAAEDLALDDLDVRDGLGTHVVRHDVHGPGLGILGVESVALAEQAAVEPGTPEAGVAVVRDLGCHSRDLDLERPRHGGLLGRNRCRSIHRSDVPRRQHRVHQ
jgi:hypothetical protein